MKLENLRSIVARGSVPLLQRRGDAEELLSDIDAEIAKARGENTGRDLVTRSLAKRIADLESSEVELREHCQGNVPMSVFNDLKKRVNSLFFDTSSLENATTRELRALAERVKALEERATGKFDEDEAYDEWHGTPWPPSMDGKHERARLEQAFREGFRAGRK